MHTNLYWQTIPNLQQTKRVNQTMYFLYNFILLKRNPCVTNVLSCFTRTYNIRFVSPALAFTTVDVVDHLLRTTNLQQTTLKTSGQKFEKSLFIRVNYLIKLKNKSCLLQVPQNVSACRKDLKYLCVSCIAWYLLTLFHILTLSDAISADNFWKYSAKEEIAENEPFLLWPHYIQLLSVILLKIVKIFHILV